MRTFTLACLILVASCAAHGGSSAAAAAVAIPAVLAPAIAETAVYRSATGYHCWAVCPEGTRCNPESQACEPLACGGDCQPGESCDTTLHPPACVSSAAALKIWRDAEAPGERAR